MEIIKHHQKMMLVNTGKVTFNNCLYAPEDYYSKLDWSRKPCAGDILYTVTGLYVLMMGSEANAPNIRE